VGGSDKSWLMHCMCVHTVWSIIWQAATAQDSVETLFRWGGRVYNFLGWNLFRILHTKYC